MSTGLSGFFLARQMKKRVLAIITERGRVISPLVEVSNPTEPAARTSDMPMFGVDESARYGKRIPPGTPTVLASIVRLRDILYQSLYQLVYQVWMFIRRFEQQFQ